jgi:hypothetical protein
MVECMNIKSQLKSINFRCRVRVDKCPAKKSKELVSAFSALFGSKMKVRFVKKSRSFVVDNIPVKSLSFVVGIVLALVAENVKEIIEFDLTETTFARNWRPA